jgi:hypothetical protein
MALNADAESNLIIQKMSNYFLSPTGEVRSDKFSEEEIQQIAELLSSITSKWSTSWRSAPRVYCVLRLIDREFAMDKLMNEGITDIWFPFSKRSLPGNLSPGEKDRFLAKQFMVNTEGLNLEKWKGQHQHFHRDDDVPLKYEKLLGRGAFGEVAEVTSKSSDKPYARKHTLRSRGFVRTRAEFEAFTRERDVMMKINHRHCIKFVSELPLCR